MEEGSPPWVFLIELLLSLVKCLHIIIRGRVTSAHLHCLIKGLL